MNLRGLQSLHYKGTLLLLIGFCDESRYSLPFLDQILFEYYVNGADPAQMLQKVASEEGLHC